MDLTLTRQNGILINLNLRAEKHGDKNVTGADLSVSVTLSNDYLAEFHPTLKAAFYRAPHPSEMDLAEQADSENPALTRLVFGSKIEGLSWRQEITGAHFTVHFGTGGKSDIKLPDVVADSFKLTFLDGGSVKITFRIKCLPDEKQIGKLSLLIGNEIEFSLVPPEAPEMADAA